MSDHALCPTKEQIREARLAAHLSQKDAAELIYRNRPQRWSEFETGAVPMQPDTWELFLFKTKQHPDMESVVEPMQPDGRIEQHPEAQTNDDQGWTGWES